MIVYSSTKDGFVNDVRLDRIEEIIRDRVLRKLHRKTAKSEFESWRASLNEMFKVMLDDEIPGSAGVSIEYSIPLTNKRVDFILSGQNSEEKDVAVIVELKQWQEALATKKDAVVRTYVNGEREVSHPSYQAWSYAALIEDFNETVRNDRISLQPCAYLHNMEPGGALSDVRYQHHIDRAPLFFKKEAQTLADFMKRFVKYGDKNKVIYRIENGVIKPSKMLADSLSSMLQGNREFILLDDQKVVYETALKMAVDSQRDSNKRVLIVQGGPGTGKSVVAINLLVEATRRGLLTQYITKNAAPREVFKARLTGARRKNQIDSLFRGSSGYYDIDPNTFDFLIVDEAHRLNEKGGLYGNLGENQIKELIAAARTTVFFIDEDQRVTFADIGTVSELEKFARHWGAEVQYLDLQSQFRCNGSDGYLAWLDNVLQIRETANPTLDGIDYDFQVFDDPAELRKAIIEKNKAANKSRMVAGYCWDWVSKKNAGRADIVFSEFGFEAKWNLAEDGSLWLIGNESVNEIGCIHTCQGLELDYVGVFVGPDLVVRDGLVVTDASKRSKHDRSVRGYKKQLKNNPAETRVKADAIIKNTYRTLMTRGMKGCFVYASDRETRDYFKRLIKQSEAIFSSPVNVGQLANSTGRL